MRTRGAWALLVLLIVSTACASTAPTGALPSGATQGGTTTTAATPQFNRTLIIAMRTEPKVLTGTQLNPTHVGASPDSPWQIFHAALTTLDDKQEAQPQLAESLPRLGTDSWRVFPDGRMETTWRLRPNLTWHDGAPLTAEDFVLSSEFAKSARPDQVRDLDGFSALDSRTIVIRYKTPNPDAGQADWEPLPRHLLGAALDQGDAREVFDGSTWWNTQFVGAGPYQMERWEPGAFIAGVAFPNYVFGKPKIERIQLVWISDANTTVANLLSGAIHFSTDNSAGFEQAAVLKREWASGREAGKVMLGTARTVYVQVQHRPEFSDPPVMLDPRFRQALAHAMDKQAIVDAVLDGEPGQAETLVNKERPYYADLDRVLSKYPNDARRSDQIMADLGLAKDGEGLYAQGGNRLSIRLQTPVSYQREALVLADSLKRAGIDLPLRVLSPAEQVNQEIASTYPALLMIQYGIVNNPFLYFITPSVTSAANRWSGRNQGGYSDPEIDRLSNAYNAALDRNERSQALVQAMKLLSDQAAYFPLYYAYEVRAHAANLSGPREGLNTNAMWKVEEWQWLR